MAGLTMGEHGIALFGQLSQMQTLLITIGGAGLATATRVVLARNDLSRKERSGAQSWLVWVPTSVSALLVCAVSSVAAPFANMILGDEKYALETILAAAGIPLAVMGQIVLATAQARREASRLVIAAVTAAIVGAGVVVGLMASGDSTLAAASLVGGPAVQLLVILAVCRTVRRGFTTKPRLSKQRRREVAVLAWASLVLGAAAACAELAARSSVVHAHGLTELAPYQPVGLLVTTSMSLILGAVATSSLIELADTQDPAVLGARIGEIVLKIIPILGLIISIVIAISPLAIALLYVPAIVGASLPLVLMAFVGEPLRALAWIAGSCLLPLGQRKSWLLVGLVTVGVQVSVGLALAPAWGVFSLVAGLVTASVATTIATLFVLHRESIVISKHSVILTLCVSGAVGGLPFLSSVMNFGTLPGAVVSILMISIYVLFQTKFKHLREMN